MSKKYKGKEIYNCELGLYRIHWEDGGTSLGCVRNTLVGMKYIAIASWDKEETPIKDIMGMIYQLELIRSVQEEYLEYNIDTQDVYNKLAAINGLTEIHANRWIDENGGLWYLSKKGFRRVGDILGK